MCHTQILCIYTILYSVPENPLFPLVLDCDGLRRLSFPFSFSLVFDLSLGHLWFHIQHRKTKLVIVMQLARYLFPLLKGYKFCLYT